MKQKIKDALKQRYNNLGLGDEAFEGVASSVATFVTDDTLESFVAAAEPVLKQYQSIADSARSKKTTELEDKIKDLEAKLAKKSEGDEGDDKQKPDLAKVIADSVAAATKPLMDKIQALEDANTVKANVTSAKEAFFGGDYMKKFKDEADDAWDRAMEIYEIGGSKLTSEELKAKAIGYFDKAVAKKGVDTSKPFKSEDTGGDAPDWSAERKRLQDSGKLPADKS